jgi:signal transduction histidine kinase
VSLTLRQRIAISLLVTAVLGHLYLSWGIPLARNIVRAGYGSQLLICVDGWRQFGNTCLPGTFSVPRASVLLTAVTLALAAALGGLVLWCGRPLRSLAATLRRFGPQNLAERTELRSPRGQFAALAESIDGMLDRVSGGYEGQRRFAANASHELRTPLAVQRTLIEVGLAGRPTAEQLDLLTKQLLETNERNEALIEGLLVLAETEQGLTSRMPQRLDALAADTVASYGRLATTAEVSLQIESVPVTVAGEAALLERLIANLVHNGIKYNHPGGEVRVRVAAGQPVLTVTNTGPVVPAEAVPRLFEPFRRARGDRLDHSGGAGLGLTIARSISTAHDGLIEAVAQPAGGLSVGVDLPLGQ